MGYPAAMKATVHLKHVAWRAGRPRFAPGPALRRAGWKGEDLKRPDGAWMALAEVEAFMQRRLAEIAARRQAKAQGRRAPPRARGRLYLVEDLFDDFFASAHFEKTLAAASRRDYRGKARALAGFDPELYVSPAAAIDKPIVLGLHERLWRVKGLHMANGMIAVLRAAYSHAEARGKVGANPCLKLRLQAPAGRVRVATPAEVAALMAAADDPAADDRPLGDAVLIALYTGQRQADVLELEARNEDKGSIRFVQAKTGARVKVRALPQLMARLAEIRARRADRAPQIVFNPRTGKAFKADDFRHRFVALRARAAQACPSLATLRFQDLRDTAVTRLALAGCTIPEIAAVSGHSLETIHAVLKHYLELGEAHADAGIEKLTQWMEREGVKV
jgi:integrase